MGTSQGPVGSVSLSGIGETSLGVAALRARESARPDRLFEDPYAQLSRCRRLQFRRMGGKAVERKGFPRPDVGSGGGADPLFRRSTAGRGR